MISAILSVLLYSQGVGGSTGSFHGHWLVVEATLGSICYDLKILKTTVVDSLDVVFLFSVVFILTLYTVGTGTGRLIQRSLLKSSFHTLAVT